MLKTPHPVPQEVDEWLSTLDDESLMQVARDAVAYASQALDKEPNAVVLEILESINDDPRELPPRRLPTVDEKLAEQNRQFKASGAMLDRWAVFLNFVTGDVRTVQLVSESALAGASEATRKAFQELLLPKHGENKYECAASNSELALYWGGYNHGRSE